MSHEQITNYCKDCQADRCFGIINFLMVLIWKLQKPFYHKKEKKRIGRIIIVFLLCFEIMTRVTLRLLQLVGFKNIFQTFSLLLIQNPDMLIRAIVILSNSTLCLFYIHNMFFNNHPVLTQFLQSKQFFVFLLENTGTWHDHYYWSKMSSPLYG